MVETEAKLQTWRLGHYEGCKPSRCQWPIKALVQETSPDSDGVVRQVLVKGAAGVFRGDICKLCPLEEDLLKLYRGVHG